MDYAYGLEAHAHPDASPPRPPIRYLVIVPAAEWAIALLFLESRELVGNVPAGSEEVVSMIEGLTPTKSGHLPEWDAALAGHSAEERAGADVYVLEHQPAPLR
jgi:hypothetical protein